MLSAVSPDWVLALSVAYVVAAQGLSGIAKDLTKMSAKSAIKLVVPAGAHGRLFRWVALLTGSKNALKGVGFFVGAFALSVIGFAPALWVMAAALALVLIAIVVLLPRGMGQVKAALPLRRLLSKSPEINRLSAARLFLFGARDVWFVVGVPVFLYDVAGWTFMQVGTFMATWVIGYGFVQAAAPLLVRRSADGASSETKSARVWAALLSLVPAAIVGGLWAQDALANDALARDWGFIGILPSDAQIVVVGLMLFGVVFAVNSAVHSYLILAYTKHADDVTLNVGFYYMANAAGRLLGTLLSGITYQVAGLTGALTAASLMVLVSFAFALSLPSRAPSAPSEEAETASS
ncbi:MAG: organoarsenical effux MFS transporter ArsJ, partial [Pseudomonadota bacterium]